MDLGLRIRLLLAAPVQAPWQPDASRTPGAINPDVTQANIAQTIGKSGWTKTVRPLPAYTDALKRTQMREWGLPGNPGDYEEDHLIPLELGGSPESPLNLWPEPWKPTGTGTGLGAATKDQLEDELKRLVLAGRLSLVDAQRAIAANWYEAYSQYVKATA